MKCTHELELENFWRAQHKRMHKIKFEGRMTLK